MMSWLMSRLRIERNSRRHAAAAYAGLVLIVGSVSLFACAEVPEEETEHLYEPGKLEPIPETDVQRVKFTPLGAKQVGVETAEIGRDGQEKVIPYAAVIYDSSGKTFTYTSPERLTYVRQEIEIDHIDGDRVVLSDGPPAGTEVVTVGAAEVYGTEFEVAH
jgi:multidrug efflux pump subunit AcrA (membrane-fusion protein)